MIALIPRRLFAAGALLFLVASQLTAQGALPRAEPESVGMSPERLARLGTELQEYVDEGRLAGAVALVARRGKVVFLEAVGSRDLETKAPLRTDDIFRIASQTKALVSTAILMLQEEGALLISDPVEKYLPEFKDHKVARANEGGGYEPVDGQRPISLRHLLTHTAGIGYGSGPAAGAWKEAGIQGWYFADRDEPIADTVARLAKLPLDAQPGESFIYGYSTDILGAVVEKVSGKDLDNFLHARILEPLGMKDTHFYLPKSKRERLTTVYSAGDEGLTKAPDPGAMVGQGAYVDGPRKSFSGGAGLLSTAPDYYRFLQMMLDQGRAGDQHLLAPSTVQLMTTDHIGSKFTWGAGSGFGLGFSVVRNVGQRGAPGSVGEYGWGGAYHSTYWVDPEEELIVVYLTQLIPAGDIDDHAKVRALVYSSILE